jgi:nucleoside-diphosphate-sugar epimerase
MNIAGGEEVAIRDLVLRIVDLTHSRSRVEIGALPYRPNEIQRMRGDGTRARQVLGWKPRISLEEGLRITIEWFRDQIARGNPVVSAR